MHVRRGDYVGKKEVHGAVTIEYYTKGLEMLRSKLLKLEPESAAEGMIVVVLTEAESVPWCKENMKWGEKVVDILSLPLPTYFTIAIHSISSRFFSRLRFACEVFSTVCSASDTWSSHLHTLETLSPSLTICMTYQCSYRME